MSTAERNPSRNESVGDLGAALLDGVERVVERARERVDALAFERGGDVVEVDAGGGEVVPSPGAPRRRPRRRCRRAGCPRTGAAPRSTPARACSRCRGRSARRRRASAGRRGSSWTSTPTAAAGAARPAPPGRPSAARRTARGTARRRAWRWRPRPCPRSSDPSGRRRSVSVSTRLTKNDATDAMRRRGRRPSPPAARAP